MLETHSSQGEVEVGEDLRVNDHFIANEMMQI